MLCVRKTRVRTDFRRVGSRRRVASGGALSCSPFACQAQVLARRRGDHDHMFRAGVEEHLARAEAGEPSVYPKLGAPWCLCPVLLAAGAVPRTRSWKLKSSSAVVGSRAPKSRISCCAIRIFSELCRRGPLFVSRRVFTGRTHTQVLSQSRTDSARTVTRRRRQICGARACDSLLQPRQAPRRDPDAKTTGAFRPCILAFNTSRGGWI